MRFFKSRFKDQSERIYISGTGRSGTTLLIRLLSHLGCDTGFSGAEIVNRKKRLYFEHARAGFEWDLFDRNGPRIIKSPVLCDKVDAVLAAGMRISHVIIPVREFAAAAASRIHVQRETTGSTSGRAVAGGLWETERAEDQEAILRSKLANLVEACVRNDIPMTFLSFPRFASDIDYLFEWIKLFIPDHVDREQFLTAAKEIIRADFIHEFPR